MIEVFSSQIFLFEYAVKQINIPLGSIINDLTVISSSLFPLDVLSFFSFSIIKAIQNDDLVEKDQIRLNILIVLSALNEKSRLNRKRIDQNLKDPKLLKFVYDLI